ncbi:hypothetical protein SEMRO_746_G196400.1 [Seminavis robusta]|uniref:Uncharacterized protein n=1 Tax=Seminavis robusta TaxID=568900 RepID=A0A9N8E7U0_9STRA|nr:hypothetical protein SEMRO_746_G196400.1 [Seminavis robusta]|eukprot:Sro746_g196400.1 n/a (197) ;mRNA; f:22740-23444
MLQLSLRLSRGGTRHFRRNSKFDRPPGKSTKEKLEEFRANYNEDGTRKLRLAPTIEAGPSVCISWEEGQERLKKMRKKLREDIDKMPELVKHRVSFNLKQIMEGRPTMYELTRAIGPTAAKFKGGLGWYKRILKALKSDPNFFKTLYEEVKRQPIQDAIQEELERLHKEERLGSRIDRIDKVLLEEMTERAKSIPR